MQCLLCPKSCGYFQVLFAVISHNYGELFLGSDVGAFINNKRIWHVLEIGVKLRTELGRQHIFDQGTAFCAVNLDIFTRYTFTYLAKMLDGVDT